MDFENIAPKMQETIMQLLDKHLSITIKILEKDKCVIPMFWAKGSKPDSNSIAVLQPKDGNTDVDAALKVALLRLKEIDFEYALFSYSTEIGMNGGCLINALKTFIFDKNGLAVVFFTPYKIRGLFNKKVYYEKSIIYEVIENVFKS
jgi:hypothetical protein